VSATSLADPRLRRVVQGPPRASARQRRLGQNFLADPNLLAAIVRDAGLEASDVVLEMGGGGGALTELLAPQVSVLHVVEMDERLRPELEPLAERLGNVRLTWGDALRLDLAGLDPAPGRMVANLPYSVATPLLLRTIEELPGLRSWLVMVQREIADRLRADPGGREYGAPSVLAQLACSVTLVRKVDPAVFTPRPRVGSALLRLERRGPGAQPGLRELVRGAFAHRRKSLARSLELARPGRLDAVRAALERLGLPADARAQALAPTQFEALWNELGAEGPG
jgi:16S rRNA (adenine1518-N6/adenine1519-N6)-dimethyltransferase